MTLLQLGADPRQRNAAGDLPIHCMLTMRAERAQQRPNSLAFSPGFLKKMRVVQRLLMKAADA